MLQLNKTSDQQPRADEQYDGDGTLKHHQQAAGAIALRTNARVSAPFLERFT